MGDLKMRPKDTFGYLFQGGRETEPRNGNSWKSGRSCRRSGAENAGPGRRNGAEIAGPGRRNGAENAGPGRRNGAEDAGFCRRSGAEARELTWGAARKTRSRARGQEQKSGEKSFLTCHFTKI